MTYQSKKQNVTNPDRVFVLRPLESTRGQLLRTELLSPLEEQFGKDKIQLLQIDQSSPLQNAARLFQLLTDPKSETSTVGNNSWLIAAGGDATASCTLNLAKLLIDKDVGQVALGLPALGHQNVVSQTAGMLAVKGAAAYTTHNVSPLEITLTDNEKSEQTIWALANFVIGAIAKSAKYLDMKFVRAIRKQGLEQNLRVPADVLAGALSLTPALIDYFFQISSHLSKVSQNNGEYEKFFAIGAMLANNFTPLIKIADGGLDKLGYVGPDFKVLSYHHLGNLASALIGNRMELNGDTSQLERLEFEYPVKKLGVIIDGDSTNFNNVKKITIHRNQHTVPILMAKT